MVDCWFKDNCKHKYIDCQRACIKYHEVLSLFEQSNIPQGKWAKQVLSTSVDSQAFRRLAEIKKNIVDNVNIGMQLYICSPICGNGKTSWAIKLAQSYISKIWAGNRFRRRVVFFSVPEFIDREHLRMNTANDDTEEFSSLREAITECDLIIWDDIGSIKTTDYTHLVLLNFISHRQVHNKANIFTGNLSGEMLDKSLGSRLASRIWNGSEIIKFNGEDRRKSW